jgi:hypothetical protein
MSPRPKARTLLAVATGLLALGAGGAAAQTPPTSPAWGRVAFFTTASQDAPREGDTSQSFAEYVTTVTYHSAVPADTSLEFGFDGRFAGYSVERRGAGTSIFEAWAGARLLDGALRVRGGNLWLTELGGLGSIGGGVAEYGRAAGKGRLRVAGFGGLEPKTYEAGYVEDVTRAGGYLAYDGPGTLRSALGYVLIRHAGLTERSVLSTTNYLPAGRRVFVYQAAEVDLQGPAGQGSGGLTYFFVNGRAAATSRVDVQGTYHRGHSIDARTITLDQLAGRPVPTRLLEGYLFESWSGRVTVTAARGVRLYAGYGQDRNDRDSEPASRVTLGGSASNLLGSGLDTTVSLYRIDRGAPGSYDSWYVSIGRSIGSRTYVSGDYNSSLSVVRTASTGDFVVESRPRTDRFSVSAIINATRLLSFLVTAERTTDDAYTESRVLAGISCRLP